MKFTKEQSNKQQKFSTKQDFTAQNMQFNIEYSEDTMQLTVDETIDFNEHDFKPSKIIRNISCLLMIFVLLSLWQAYSSIITAINTSNWLALSWLIFGGIFIILTVRFLIRELIYFRSLNEHFDEKEQAKELFVNNESFGKAAEFCRALANKTANLTNTMQYDRWIHNVNANHSDAEILTMYSDMVISLQDTKVKKTISQTATQSGLLMVLSPLAITDVLVVSWCSFRMLNKIAQVYGIKLGYSSKMTLVKYIILNMLITGVSDLAVDASFDFVSSGVAGKISAQIGKAIGVSLLTARLGIKAFELMRPLPIENEAKIKLSGISQAIINEIMLKFKA